MSTNPARSPKRRPQLAAAAPDAAARTGEQACPAALPLPPGLPGLPPARAFSSSLTAIASLMA